MASQLQAAKQQLRLLVKQRLAAVSNESVTSQSQLVFETVTKLKHYKDAQRISIFLSMPTGEIQTDAIVRHALDSGKQVFVPYLHRSHLQTPDTPTRVMDMVSLKSLQDYESLERDKWGIPSVSPSTISDRSRILGGPGASTSSPGTLDMILMPGVAFDFDGSGGIRRLGHGRGFYDFFVNRYCGETDTQSVPRDCPILYGLGLKEQLLSGNDQAIPEGLYDRRLHGLVLGNGEVREGVNSDAMS